MGSSETQRVNKLYETETLCGNGKTLIRPGYTPFWTGVGFQNSLYTNTKSVCISKLVYLPILKPINISLHTST